MKAFSWFLVTTGIRILEGVFVLGIAGSAVVFILSAIDDVRDIFAKDVARGKGAD